MQPRFVFKKWQLQRVRCVYRRNRKGEPFFSEWLKTLVRNNVDPNRGHMLPHASHKTVPWVLLLCLDPICSVRVTDLA